MKEQQKGIRLTLFLATGGTGALGTPTVQQLREGGHHVRALSRRRADGLTTGDLLTGEGIREAVDSVDCVLHLATNGDGSDVLAVRNLVTAARDANVPHIVLISIVGIDVIPLRFFRQRLDIEHAVVSSGLAFTILRATQFHSFVDQSFARQRFSPAVIAPAFRYQSIAVHEVANRLVDIAAEPPSGRVPDIGGPQRLAAQSMAIAWKAATGARRPVLTVDVPGRAFRAMAAGGNLVEGSPYGRQTFASYLTDTYGTVLQ